MFNVVPGTILQHLKNNNVAIRVNKLDITKRQISINFISNSIISLRRTNKKSVTMQGYGGVHPYIQIISNKALPENLWNKLDDTQRKSVTFPVEVELNLNEWN